MKCRCGNEIGLEIQSKIKSRGCLILTGMVTVVTVKCKGCNAVVQIPIQIINKRKTDKPVGGTTSFYVN